MIAKCHDKAHWRPTRSVIFSRRPIACRLLSCQPLIKNSEQKWSDETSYWRDEYRIRCEKKTEYLSMFIMLLYWYPLKGGIKMATRFDSFLARQKTVSCFAVGGHQPATVGQDVVASPQSSKQSFVPGYILSEEGMNQQPLS
jgi:hypothetical protein